MIRNKIQAKVGKAFDKKLADAVHPFTCERISKTNWDPKTETYVEVKENYSGRGVLFGSYSQYEIQTLGVLATDKKATVLQNEVTMAPKIDDEWLTALGSFRIIHIQQDPASTIWKCQLRKV
ncbi:glutamate 5-kinase [uncultured Acinetobacter sp.]|uniref:glutamate 5-kinase n=1 Tax=uncultured Acinetobacter sp. TaxID=165433 RepID=UPI002588CDD0|nr:glutamate 5-kinase [uncultured Acinetobacter sp.]